MTKTAEPRTYTDAIKVAERLSPEDFADALSTAKSFTVLKQRRAARHVHAFSVDRSTGGHMVLFAYDYCDSKGYSVVGSDHVSATSYRIGRGIVVHLYNEGRFVALKED